MLSADLKDQLPGQEMGVGRLPAGWGFQAGQARGRGESSAAPGIQVHRRPWQALGGQLKAKQVELGEGPRVGSFYSSWQLFLGLWQAGLVVPGSRHLLGVMQALG